MPNKLASCLTGLLLAAVAAAPANAGPLPWTLTVDVGWSATPGPGSVLEETRAELLLLLRTRACYREVRAPDPAESPGPGDDELLLRVRLQDFLEEVRYEASIAERATSYEPGVDRKLVAEFRVRARMDLLRAADELPIRSSSVFIAQRARPVTPGQDDDYARDEARRLGVEELVDGLVRRSCRGSAQKLERAIRKAETKRSASR